MSENILLKPKQEHLLTFLLQGSTILDAARRSGVTDRTARRWLNDPVIQAEMERRQIALREAEQAEIARILTSGYALMHRRVEALDRMARELEKPYTAKNGKVYQLADNPEKVREWRACLDDIARELGQRVKKADVTSAGEKMAGPQIVFYLPEVDEDENASDSKSCSCS